MNYLYQHNVQSLLVEGGAFTLQSFIDIGCWDEAFVEISSNNINDGISAPMIREFDVLESTIHFGHSILHYKK